MVSFFDRLSEIIAYIKQRWTLEKFIELPAIITIGAESSGKSSLLENITQREIFPKNKKRCTMCPVKIINKHSSESYAIITFREETHEAKDDEMIIQKVQEIFDTFKSPVNEVVTITLSNKNLPDELVFMDLPGLCLNENDEATYDIARNYITGNVLILCTVATTITRFTADPAINFLSKENKLKSTIIVLTFPDRVPEDDIEEFLVDRINGSEINKESIINIFSVASRATIRSGKNKHSLEECRVIEKKYFQDLKQEFELEENFMEHIGSENLIHTLDAEFRTYIHNKWYPQTEKQIEDEISNLIKKRDTLPKKTYTIDFIKFLDNHVYKYRDYRILTETINVDLFDENIFSILDDHFDTKFCQFGISQERKIDIVKNFMKELSDKMIKYIIDNFDSDIRYISNKDIYPDTCNLFKQYLTDHINSVNDNNDMITNFGNIMYYILMMNSRDNEDKILSPIYKLVKEIVYTIPDLPFTDDDLDLEYNVYVKRHQDVYNNLLIDIAQIKEELGALFEKDKSTNKYMDVSDIKNLATDIYARVTNMLGFTKDEIKVCEKAEIPLPPATLIESKKIIKKSHKNKKR